MLHHILRLRPRAAIRSASRSRPLGSSPREKRLTTAESGHRTRRAATSPPANGLRGNPRHAGSADAGRVAVRLARPIRPHSKNFRKVAAELVQRYPEVVEPLKDGRLCITSVVELAKVITPENRAEILPRFFHTSKKEAKEVSAEIRPLEAAPHRLVVTAARPAPAPREATAQPPVAGPPLPRVRPDEPRAAELPMASQPAPAKVEPLSADLRRLHITVSKRFMQKL